MFNLLNTLNVAAEARRGETPGDTKPDLGPWSGASEGFTAAGGGGPPHAGPQRLEAWALP